MSRFVEYVVAGDSGYLSSPNSHLAEHNFSIPDGLFGYSSRPNLQVDGNASGYTLYYADPYGSPLIKNAGRGLKKDNFNPLDIFRVSGAGYSTTQGSTKQPLIFGTK